MATAKLVAGTKELSDSLFGTSVDRPTEIERLEFDRKGNLWFRTKINYVETLARLSL